MDKVSASRLVFGSFESFFGRDAENKAISSASRKSLDDDFKRMEKEWLLVGCILESVKFEL